MLDNVTVLGSFKRTIAILIVFILALAIPITLLLVRTRQDIRQRAAGREEPLPAAPTQIPSQ